MRRARDLKPVTPRSITGEPSYRDSEVPPRNVAHQRGFKRLPQTDATAYKVRRSGSELRPHSGTHPTERGKP